MLFYTKRPTSTEEPQTADSPSNTLKRKREGERIEEYQRKKLSKGECNDLRIRKLVFSRDFCEQKSTTLFSTYKLDSQPDSSGYFGEDFESQNMYSNSEKENGGENAIKEVKQPTVKRKSLKNSDESQSLNQRKISKPSKSSDERLAKYERVKQIDRFRETMKVACPKEGELNRYDREYDMPRQPKLRSNKSTASQHCDFRKTNARLVRQKQRLGKRAKQERRRKKRRGRGKH